jgi:hypothetical protein
VMVAAAAVEGQVSDVRTTFNLGTVK